MAAARTATTPTRRRWWRGGSCTARAPSAPACTRSWIWAAARSAARHPGAHKTLNVGLCVYGETALLPAHAAAPVQQPGHRPTRTALASCMTCERRALGVRTTAAHSEQRSSAKTQPSCCAPCFPDRPGRIHAAQRYITSARRRAACGALFAAAVQASQARVLAPLLQRWPLRPGSTDCCAPPERQNPDPEPLLP